MEKKEFKLKWPEDSGPAVYANNITVQAEVSGMFYVTFFQAIPPILVGTENEQLEKIRAIEEIEARPIVKLGLNRDTLESLSKILQKHLSSTDERNES